MGIQNRNKEMAAIIIIPMLLFIGAIMFQGIKINLKGGITGFAVYEEQGTYYHNIIDGVAFEITYQGATSTYIFNEKRGWYESSDGINWQRRPDLTKDMWAGLTYFYLNGADIYYNNQKITNLATFARNFR